MLVKDPGTRACFFVMLSSISGVGGGEFCKRRNWDIPSHFWQWHVKSSIPGYTLLFLLECLSGVCFTWSGKVIKFYSRSHNGWPPFSNPGKNCGCISRSVSCSALPLPPWQMERGFMPPQGKLEVYPVTFWWSQIRRGARSLPMSESAIDTSIP